MKQWGQSQPSVDSRLLYLPYPYHGHAVGTFNTCWRGPTHRFLIDTSEGYNFGGAALPHTTPRPSQPTVLPFSPKGPAQSPVYQVLSTKPVFEFKGTYDRHMVFRPLGHLPWPTTMPSHSKRPISSHRIIKNRSKGHLNTTRASIQLL
jgi:hypothetical protein